jgi:hypothetical protein
MLKKKSGRRLNSLSPIVDYKDSEAIGLLLGAAGLDVLGKVIEVIFSTSQQEKWSLTRVEVDFIEDCEVENWQYVRLLLFFDTDFDTADAYLHALYSKLDELALKFTEPEKEILQRKLFFDVRTGIPGN